MGMIIGEACDFRRGTVVAPIRHMPTWFPHFAEEIERVTPVPRPPIEDPPLPHPAPGPGEPGPDSPQFPGEPPDPLPID